MADEEHPDEMSEIDYLRAQFFSAEPYTPPVAAVKRRRLRKPKDLMIRALYEFTRVLETQDPRERLAAIKWLASRYLGWK